MVEEDVNLQTARAPVKGEKKGDPRIARFTASILLLATIGLMQMIGQRMAIGGPMLIAQLIFVLFCAFTHEWNLLHGEGLTRHRRAYFDVVNVLETYQTRARTMGHLFQPDPPTPLVTFLPDGTAVGGNHEASTEKTEFHHQRDAHYANMFQFAMQMNKELDMMEKGTADNKAEPGQGSAQGKPSSSESAKKGKAPPSQSSKKDKPASTTSSKKSAPSKKKEGSQKSDKKKGSQKKDIMKL